VVSQFANAKRDRGNERGREGLALPHPGCPFASFPGYSRANSYPWSPFLPRRARPGPGPHMEGLAPILALTPFQNESLQSRVREREKEISVSTHAGLAPPTCVLTEKEIGNLFPNNHGQRRTCYALCHILDPVSAAHMSISRKDLNSISYELTDLSRVDMLGGLVFEAHRLLYHST